MRVGRSGHVRLLGQIDGEAVLLQPILTITAAARRELHRVVSIP